jgi:hypothetical protein
VLNCPDPVANQESESAAWSPEIQPKIAGLPPCPGLVRVSRYHIRQDGPGLVTVPAGRKGELEGDNDAGQPVPMSIADLVRVGPHLEAVRSGPVAR